MSQPLLNKNGIVVEILDEDDYDADIDNGNVCVEFVPGNERSRSWLDDSQLEFVT